MTEDVRNGADERDDVAALLRLAGKRGAVPAARAERVRAAARAEWKAEVGRRARGRRMVVASGLAAAASIVLVVTLWNLPNGTEVPPPPPDPGIPVEVLVGPAWGTLPDEPGERFALRVGDEVRSGATLTTGEGGRLAVRLPTGHSVRLDAASRLRLLGAGTLALDAGAIFVDSGFDREASGGLEVVTPLGSVREIGTQFEVRLEDDAVRVRLREGAVVVRRREETLDVRAGNELRLEPDGSVSRRAVLTHGAEWAWIADVAPLPEFDGRTARAFLDWAAREGGFDLIFTDEAVARAADDTVLGGSFRGLTPRQALDAVLPTCRMTYRIDEGRLVVGKQ